MTNALVPIAPNRDLPPAGDQVAGQAGARPRADFLAQLIATAAQAPQTRVRRRAEPEEAIAAYDASGRFPARNGYALSRSL